MLCTSKIMITLHHLGYTPKTVVIDNYLPRQPLISSYVLDWPLPPRVYIPSESEMALRARIYAYNRHLSFEGSVHLQYFDALWRLSLERMTSKMGSELRASECLPLEMIFVPIKLCVTAASAMQNVRYCFPTWNTFTAAVGLWNMLWW